MQTLEPRKTLVEQTYDALVDAICIGSLAPGERLTEDALAARLNVSRQPVNAALAMLRANHLVEATGRRGVVVSRIDPTLYRNIYDLRSVIEPLAVELAGRQTLTLDDHAEGQRIVADGWKAKRANDTLGMVRADVEFHSFIYRISGNSVIENTMRVYWQHIRRAMVEILRGEGYPDTVWSQHEAIYATLAEGRIDDAAAIMRQHIVGGFAVIEAQGLGQSRDTQGPG
jgi:DNA-binding GntR family transcriptional regulator